MVAIFVVAVAIAELYVFVLAADAFGFWNALGLLIVISLVGVWVVKREGLRVVSRFRQIALAGSSPSREIADGALDEIRIYFPDPWHKKRHNKRRLVQPEFAALLVRKLRPGGRLHLATDWEPYAEHMWDVLESTPGLANRAGPRGHVPRPEWRPETHFERRGVRLGHGVWDLLYDRTDAAALNSPPA